ncbi:MAG: TetR/AcrR family transcriptional regulator [Rikenellaceae bacterium]
MMKNTKQKYAESLLELLEKHPYEGITISQICENTSLTRRTFYNNFSSKDEVVVFICEQSMDEFVAELHRNGVYTLKNISTIFYTVGARKHKIFEALIKNDIFHFLIKTFVENVKYLAALVPNNPLDKKSEERQRYTYLFHTVGVLKLYEEWLRSGMTESPEELSNIYISIVRD